MGDSLFMIWKSKNQYCALVYWYSLRTAFAFGGSSTRGSASSGGSTPTSWGSAASSRITGASTAWGWGAPTTTMASRAATPWSWSRWWGTRRARWTWTRGTWSSATAARIRARTTRCTAGWSKTQIFEIFNCKVVNYLGHCGFMVKFTSICVVGSAIFATFLLFFGRDCFSLFPIWQYSHRCHRLRHLRFFRFSWDFFVGWFWPAGPPHFVGVFRVTGQLISCHVSGVCHVIESARGGALHAGSQPRSRKKNSSLSPFDFVSDHQKWRLSATP